MKRICAVMIGLALLVVTPGLATADSTHQQAINLVIQRALSQRGVPYAYGGGNVAGPSLGTASVDTPVGAADASVHADPLPGAVGATGLNLSPVAGPVAEPRVSRSDSIRPVWCSMRSPASGSRCRGPRASSTRSGRRCCRRRHC